MNAKQYGEAIEKSSLQLHCIRCGRLILPEHLGAATVQELGYMHSFCATAAAAPPDPGPPPQRAGDIDCDVCHTPIREEDIRRSFYVASHGLRYHLWCVLDRSAVDAAQAAASAAFVPMAPGPRPHDTCCEKCRLTPGYGITDGVRFLCMRCAE